MNYTLLNSIIVIYVGLIAYLGYLGYKHTNSTKDYLVAGGEINPFIMALSYGAAFISTSAIIGFGGAAGAFGMGLLWLTFFTIFVGIFIAFVFFGKRTRQMGQNLEATTFPDLLGKRYDSNLIRAFSSLIIFVFMPLYAGAVLIGAARFLETGLGISYITALIVFTAIITVYVTTGGLKGVMYADAFQGSIMFLGMAFLIIYTYVQLGGFTNAHVLLTDMVHLVPAKLQAIGHQGWTSMPKFGSALWWVVISTLVLGVGIGTLAQPQLAVKFMTVKSNKSLNRATLIGGIFIFSMTGVAFVVGALSNAYFFKNFGKTALEMVGGNFDKVIPLFIKTCMPEWFAYIFMLTLIAAAISTLSSLFHVMGASIGKDLYESMITKDNRGSQKQSMFLIRTGIVAGILLSLLLGYILPISIIARATAMFFGIAAATFLPMFMLGIYWKGVTRIGAISGMFTGALSSIFWLVFIHKKEAVALGISQAIFGKPFLIETFPWMVVDPIIVALPLSLAVTIAVSFFTGNTAIQPPHLKKCFEGIG
ncbi:sodium:solute symporter family protein [Desulfobacula toluolica]|uniref:Sodium/solute symporter n=1 Tax=Desulfobacula toluolica (strain DSM 7467 / Tol2) TaxID=651182 RepID=K0NBP2_DESTT|nr:sodium:solute symporter family protein [Desulfobacula toluolica]CCK81774.1 sodium/solute symporter [Desulfobacula toluolica Tol2]